MLFTRCNVNPTIVRGASSYVVSARGALLKRSESPKNEKLESGGTDGSLEVEDLFVLASSTLASLQAAADKDPARVLSGVQRQSVKLLLGWVRQKALEYAKDGFLHEESYRLLKDVAFDRRKASGDALLAGDAIFLLQQCISAVRLAEMRRRAGGGRKAAEPVPLQAPRLELVRSPAEDLFGWDGDELRILETGK